MRAVGATQFWMDDRAPVETLRLRRSPLLAAAIAFACGELLARHWQFAPILLAALAALLGLALFAMRTSLRVAPVPILALWTVAGCWCAQMQPSPPPQTALTEYADGLSRIVRGRVIRIRILPAKPLTPHTLSEAAPEPWKLEPGAWEAEGVTPAESIDLDVDQIEYITPDVAQMRPAQGGIRITVLDGSPKLQCGDILELPLRLRQPERYRDAGAWSYTDDLLSQGISLQSNVKAPRVQKVGSTSRTFRCRAYAAQAWASARMAALTASHANHLLPKPARLSADDTSMLNAMLFSDRAGLRHDLRVGFERTGSFHLFVVSGMHVALLAGMLFYVLRRLRAPHSLATILTIASTAAYAMLTGFGVPVQRALLMTSVFLIARWLGRNVGVLQALGTAALTVLIADPRALTEASFQMTFLVLIAVGGLAMPMAERTFLPRLRAARALDATWLDARLPPHLAQMRVTLRLFGRALASLRLFGVPFPFRSAAKESAVPRTRNPARRWRYHLPALTLRLALHIVELALVGLVIEACMSLPMAVYFHRATPFAVPANLVAIPLVAVLAPLAVITFCASLVSTWLAAIPAALTALALHGVNYAITHLSHMRFADTRVPSPSQAIVITIITTLAFACWAIRKRSRWLFTAGLLTTALIPLATLWPEAPLLHPNTLEVTALDVGQGDSLLVVSPDGHTLLVDAGGPVGQASDPTRWDVGEEVVAPYLWSRRLRRLDAVLLTHAHSDHMGGMPAILRDFHPAELWLSIDPTASPDYQALLALAASLHIRVRHLAAPDTFAWGALTASVLSPEPTYLHTATPSNDDSLVLRLDLNKSSVLLEGDAERRSEDTMLANHRIAPVTLLKIGHHGSRTSTTPDFLAAASPHAAIISSGRRNTFGHPRYEILQRLADAHIKTIRTDREGATTFLLKPDGTFTTLSAAN